MTGRWNVTYVRWLESCNALEGAAATRPRNNAPTNPSFKEREDTALSSFSWSMRPPFDMTITNNRVILRTLDSLVNPCRRGCEGTRRRGKPSRGDCFLREAI